MEERRVVWDFIVFRQKDGSYNIHRASTPETYQLAPIDRNVSVANVESTIDAFCIRCDFIRGTISWTRQPESDN